jgi:hypothetical protein
MIDKRQYSYMRLPLKQELFRRITSTIGTGKRMLTKPFKPTITCYTLGICERLLTRNKSAVPSALRKVNISVGFVALKPTSSHQAPVYKNGASKHCAC